MLSFCAVLFRTRFLGDIWDLIEAVSEGFFFAYSYSDKQNGRKSRLENKLNNTRCADWVTMWVVFLPERTEIGGPTYRIGPHCAGHT